MTAHPDPPPAGPLDGRGGAGAAVLDEAAVLDGAHPHGYLLVGEGAVPAPDTAGWRVEPELLPGVAVLLHPRTVLSRGHGASGSVLLLGHPVDVGAGITDGDRIAGRLAGTWDLGGPDALVREAATLGGRWTLVAGPRPGGGGRATADRTAAELLVVPDAHASQPVFHAVAGGRFALGSTPALVARTLGLEVDGSALALLEELRRRRGGAVTYLPGRRTAYLGLDPLVPNCLLRVRPGGTPGTAPAITHERFWPWREREETTDARSVYRAFRERLGAHVDLLAGLGRPAVSLTAGWDSRVSAGLARDALRAADGFAFTYVNPRDARGGRTAMADVTGASAVAARLGLPHRVLRWRQPPPGGTFDVLHRRTYDPLLPSRGAAHAMWADLPRELVQLQSNGGETGTTFIRRRTDEPLSPLRLARMMMGTDEGLEDLAGQMYDGYQEHAAMTADRLLGYDHHDVFYWEQRMGRWGWQKFTDGDLGHRILLPFNDRVLLETMLSLPYPQREAKVLLARVLDEQPAAHLPRRRPAAPGGGSGTRLAATLSRQVGSRLPGAAGRLGDRVGRRLERAERDRSRALTHERLGWPRGYAVLPTSAPAARPGWVRQELPGGTVTLETHPALARAQVALDDGVVLVLGDPVDVEAGLVGAGAVAGALAEELRTHPGTPASVLTGVEARAATLAGSWVVLVSTPARTVVLADPLVSLGLHLVEGGTGVVSHAGLAPGAATCLGGDQLLAAAGPLGVVPLRAVPLPALVDLPEAARRSADRGWTRDSRLARHVQLLRGRGPVWLGLAGGTGSAQLLSLLAENTAVDGASSEGAPRGGGGQGDRPAVHTLTWWDRLASDEAAAKVFAASALVSAARVPHRVLGLREDVDGSPGEPGRSARRAALAALVATWDTVGEDVAPLGDALDQALPGDAVLWLASRPMPSRTLGAPARPAELCCGPRTVDLVQGVRPVALPLSDRLLALLPR